MLNCSSFMDRPCLGFPRFGLSFWASLLALLCTKIGASYGAILYDFHNAFLCQKLKHSKKLRSPKDSFMNLLTPIRIRYRGEGRSENLWWRLVVVVVVDIIVPLVEIGGHP